MGFFSKLIEQRDLSLTEPKAWNPGLWNLYGRMVKSGANVNEETAMGLSAVFNAVSLISGAIASMPLHLMKDDGRNKTRALDRPVYRVLHSRTNSEMVAMVAREVMAVHVLLWGNSFSLIVTNGLGQVIELWPIAPQRVKVDRDSNGLIYIVKKSDGSEVVFPGNQILHVPGLGFDGLMGRSVVSLASESLGLGMAMEEFGARWFGSGTHPGVIVSHPGRLGQEAHDNLKGDLTAKYSGLGKSHKLMLLEEGMKLENVGVPPEDSQFLQSRQFQINEVARWFNLPPHKIKDLTRSSFNNIEQEQISYVVDSLIPWLVRFEQNFNGQLLSDKERTAGYYCKHVVEGLLRGDSESRGRFYNQMFMIGGMSVNEIREKEDLNPIPGGDEHFVPLNMVPLRMAGREVKPELEPEPERTLRLPETRSVAERNTIQNSYYPMFAGVTSRILDMETKEVRRAVSRFLGKRTRAEFGNWLEEFYDGHHLTVMREMKPLLVNYADEIQRSASAAVGAEPGMSPELTEFVNQYAETLGLRYSSSSLGQLRSILEGTGPDEVGDEIENRLAEWSEKRPEKVALNETVRANNAVTKFVWVAAGITRLIWVAQGSQSCPYCQELNGRTVGVRYPFVGEGEFNPPGADGSMKIRGPHFHPPLHQGCVCSIRPGWGQ